MISDERGKEAAQPDKTVFPSEGQESDESWKGDVAILQIGTEAATARAGIKSNEKLHMAWLAVVVLGIIVTAGWTVPMVKEHPAWWGLFQDQPEEAEQDCGEQS